MDPEGFDSSLSEERFSFSIASHVNLGWPGRVFLYNFHCRHTNSFGVSWWLTKMTHEGDEGEQGFELCLSSSRSNVFSSKVNFPFYIMLDRFNANAQNLYDYNYALHYL